MDPKQAGNQPGYPQEGSDAQPGYTVQPQKGHSYDHSAVIVTQPVASAPVVNSVPDNMGLAVFTTFFCCWLIGLFAIMKASEARTARATGSVELAQTLSRESRRLSLIGIGVGCISRTALESGDIQRAQTLSQESRRLSLFSIIGGIVSIVIFIIAAVFSITNRSSYYYKSY